MTRFPVFTYTERYTVQQLKHRDTQCIAAVLISNSVQAIKLYLLGNITMDFSCKSRLLPGVAILICPAKLT